MPSQHFHSYKPRPLPRLLISGLGDMLLFTRLSEAQLHGLKTHKYSSQGISLVEPLMQVFWRWLVTKIPLWVAPNLITGVGLLINAVTILPILLLDTNLEGHAPSWTYIAAAIGILVYQSLDAIDGKQARRTDSANQLGELFDHGCDTFSTFLVLLAGVSSVGLHDYPVGLLLFVVLLGQINFVYHWQAYVSGTLFFKLIDVTEGQFVSIALLAIRGVWGLELWNMELPVLGFQMKKVLLAGVLAISLLNMLQAFYVIMTSGVGKNGTTVANTSVLSPLVTILALAPVPFLYMILSPSPIYHHCLLFVTAMCLPTTKAIILMILSAMTKSPYPLLCALQLAPWIALFNVYIGSPIPETLVLAAIVVWELVDLSVMCVSICVQIADFLRVPIFTLPRN